MNDRVSFDGREYARVCRRDELRPGRGRLVFFDEERQIALFNVDGEILAVNNICPHQHAPVLFDGHVENCTVTCPLHGNVYDLKSGAAEAGGASLKTFDVRIVDDMVHVEVPAEEMPAWMRGM